jgi:amino acid adenylation domain-containing protein
VSELQQESTGGHRDYWLQRFAGKVPPPAQLPVDFRRPAALSFRGGSIRFSIDTNLAAAFRKLTRRADAGLFEGLLAVSRILLYRYSHEPSTVIGTSVAGRNHIDLENQVGFYVNTLPLKTNIETGDSFLSLLEREKQTVREALDHAVYPFDVLVEELNLPRDTSRAPLFDVRVVMEQGMRDFTGSGVSVRRMNVKSEIAKFDLVFNFAEAGSGLEVEIDYSADLFLQGTIERIFGHLEQLMQGVVAEPARAVEHLRLLPVAEAQLIQGFASGGHVPPPDETLASWFEKTAAAYPNRPAVMTETGSCTYLELNALADRVAATMEQLGIRAEERVAVIGDRTTFWLAAMIGVMKSRATYVPLDPQQPRERLHYVLENSGCRVLIGSVPLEVVPEFTGAVIHPGNTAEAPAREKRAPLSSDAAYIVYTSGSTGVPKGVIIEHGGFINMIAGQIRGFGVVPDDRVLQFSSAAFDASLSEIFMTILTGAALLVPEMTTLQNTGRFMRCLNDYKITVATLPPVYVSALNRRLAGLKVLISAGEAANADDLRLYAERMNVFNAYGPTEASVCATFHHVSAGNSGEMAIGKPLPNTSVLILSPALEEMPIGAAGEIFLAGAGLARGYVGLPEATAQAFITHNGRRLYRTGDWGKWLADGNIVFLGRRDDQVKIRGYRVELEEVRQSILRHAEVSEATVLVDSSSGPPLLAAFYTSKSGLDPGALRQFLCNQVPGFLVPDVLAPILELPLTTNGKIDRAALRERLRTDAGAVKIVQSPSNSLESRLLPIWQRALCLESFGVDDSFFDLGGNSLKAINLVAGVQREFGVDLSLRTIFAAPTVRAMADRIQESLRTVTAIPAAPGQSDYPLTPTQRAIWASLQIEGNSSKFNMPAVAVFEGPLRVEALDQAVSDLASRFEALRAVVCMTNGQPRQRFLDDVRGFRFQDPAGNLDEFVSRETTMLFDIENGPLFRIVLARDGASRWVLVTVLHHLIGDAWTMNLMQRELLRFYGLRARGLAAGPARSDFRYRDYACWFESLPGVEEMSDARKYWTAQLHNWPVCRLPADGLIESNDDGDVIHREFTPVLVEIIAAVARQQEMTVFTFLSGCAAIWLSRRTGNSDVAMGAPFSGRVRAGFEDELGLFMNVVPLRLQVHAEMSGADFWSQVKTTALSASQHQAFPVETLASGVPFLRERGSSPLFYVELHLDQFDYTYADELDSLPEQITIGAYEAGRQFLTRKYEVELHFQWLAGRAALDLVYDSTRFRAATAERWASELTSIMEAAAQHWSVWLQSPIKSMLLEVDGRFKKVDREQRDQFSRRHRPSFQQLHHTAKSREI